MTHNGFENLRMEGRRQLLKLLEPYLDHTWECLMDKTSKAAKRASETGNPRQSVSQFDCVCGLDEIIARVNE